MEEMEVEGFRKDLLYPGSFDCVVSNLALHWMNDLPGSVRPPFVLSVYLPACLAGWPRSLARSVTCC